MFDFGRRSKLQIVFFSGFDNFFHFDPQDQFLAFGCLLTARGDDFHLSPSTIGVREVQASRPPLLPRLATAFNQGFAV
jgi:hypothetical protein